MLDPLSRAAAEAVALLRRLGDAGSCSPSATDEVRRWADLQPELEVTLLADRPPSSQEVEYDLMLRIPDAGVLGMTWRREGGVPWLVRYADHWASNLVVTVNGRSTTVQQVLVMLRLSTAADHDLLTSIVDQQLLVQAAGAGAEVESDVVQAAADAIRRRLGLQGAEETRMWLSQLGLSEAQFEAMARAMVQADRFVDSIAPSDELERRFAADTSSFDRVHVGIVRAEDVGTARALAATARSDGLATAVQRLLPDFVELRISRSFTCELPSELAGVSRGQVVGPFQGDGGCFQVGEIFEISPAVLDSETRGVIRQLIRDEWLAQQRASSDIEWHWM